MNSSARPSRPFWYPLTATLWLLMILPGYIGGLLYRGTLNPFPDPQGGDLWGAIMSAFLCFLIFVVPVFLVRAELRLRRERRMFKATHAQD